LIILNTLVFFVKVKNAWRQAMNDRRRSSGFTLLEALVVLALVAVLAGMAAPAMGRLRQQHRMQAQAEALFSSLMLARSEALRQQQRVTVCARTPDDRCASAGPWTQGWMVFVDTNANAQRESQERLLQKHEALPSGMALEGNFSGGHADFVPSGCHAGMALGHQCLGQAQARKSRSRRL
jgi:prepilin-type N-terminal cleavage/methylation domain-containing protein